MEALYNTVLKILTDYLGPVSGRFLDRNIRSHLKKEPAELIPEDLPKIVEWIRITIGMVSRDSKMADECAERIAGINAVYA